MVDVLEKIKNGSYNTKYPKDIKDKEERRIAMQAYREECSRKDMVFKEDLETEFGTTDYSKKDAVFRKAWEDGHASGLTEVYYEYSELVELIDFSNTPSLG